MFLLLIFIKAYSLKGNLDIISPIQCVNFFFCSGISLFQDTTLCISLIYKTDMSESILVEAGKGAGCASHFSWKYFKISVKGLLCTRHCVRLWRNTDEQCRRGFCSLAAQSLVCSWRSPRLKVTDLIQGLEKKSDLAKGKPSWSSNPYLDLKLNVPSKCYWHAVEQIIER